MEQEVSKTGKTPSGADGGEVHAVIFLGASACSMMVAEVGKARRLRVLDVLSQPVGLARDVFNGNTVSRETMNRCVQIIRGYGALLEEYRLGGQVRLRLLATNVLLDVNNRDAFVNRLQISCGIQLEVMDDGEMTRLLYQNMQAMLARHPELERKRVLVLHVGPGNTRVLVFDRGRISYYASYRLGAHRTGEAIGAADVGDPEGERSLIREHIRGVMEQIRHDADDALPTPPDAMVVFGPDFHRISSPLVDRDSVSVDDLADLAGEIAATPYGRRMERYREDYANVGALLPSALIYLSVAREFEPGAIIFQTEEFSNSFLRSLIPARRHDAALDQEVIHFALLQAGRYRVDRAHSQQVRRLCSLLFDQLQELHGLSRHDRLLLKVAAVLHEVGAYINPKRHHHHSQYIILNSEIFGLSRRDVEMVGLLARYHRHACPTMKDRSYAELDLQDRMRMQKMAALLRVADAMERAHSHRISTFSVRFNNRCLEILVPGVHDLTLENMAMRDKANLFTDIFGYDIQLIPAQ